MLNPLLDASEIAVTGPDAGRIRLAGGFANHGEAARLVRDADGRVCEVRLGGSRLLPEAGVARELVERYGGPA
jgi:hypothetical protein